ncbi:MAG: tetratricopeptide repeat protein [Chitinophagaceae bacterium]
MNRCIKILFFIVAIALFNTNGVNAQSTKVYNDPDADFKKAKEFFQKEQYSLAYPFFKELHLNGIKESNYPNHLKTEADYYYILSGLILDDASIIGYANEFLDKETNVARTQIIYFQLGEYNFRQQQYELAINMYAKSGIDNLSNSEIAQMQFHKAYSYFATQQFKESKNLFNSIRQIPTDPNYIDANYYYGFISFYDKQYDDALKAFTVAEKDVVYQNVVPFYIAEIYYFNGNRDKALSYGEAALNNGGAKMYAIELKQLVGHLYFDKKEYAQALPYLEYYVNKSDKVRREDLYELSFCYYAAKNLTKAIEGFKQLGGKEDSLAQNSMYLLADAYLKTNQKASARNAFLFCAGNSSHQVQKEVSAFNYAKLSYELGYLDITIKDLQLFLNDYPKSAYTTETKELLVSALANTSNYKDALDLFEKLPAKTESVNKIYPRILYARAIELINDRQIDKAELLLDKLMKAPYNTSQIQLANFWKGEIAYRNGSIDDAAYYFSTYLSAPQTNGEVNVSNAKYNLAYCLLKKESYKEALVYFEQVGKNAMITSPTMEQDAYLRSGDCYFMQKSFPTALKIYDNVITQNFRSADYAMYQKAVIAGATGKQADKIALLQNLPGRYPNSSLAGEALLEIANTYIAAEDYEKALYPLQEIIKNKTANILYPQAYLKLGVANFNLDKNEEALKQFSYLVKQYSNTQEADESIEYIRNIFVETQRPNEFINFMKQSGKPVTYTEADSLTYRSAYIRFEAKDTANARKGFINYLSNYPDGKYALDANYLLAELNYTNKNSNAALPLYENIAAKSPNKYAERCALQAARIYYFEMKDVVNAEKYFAQAKTISSQQENKLEAMRGLLRCQYKQQKWKDAQPNAKDLLAEKSIATDDKMMANLIVAKVSQNENKLDDAITFYKQVTVLGKTEFSAEANYRISEVLYLQDKLTESEKVAFETIKKFGSYEYWLTKSYILLGDIYFKQKDLFNAEATYKSIAENSTVEELKKEAQQKLATLIAEKDKVNKVETN